ncbi:MAG: hypothetical protein OXI18_04945 [bacterium]|nr:hypothetical protein [bacterium]
MTALDPDLRSLLDRAVLSARESAELAATAALERLAVGQNKPFGTHSDAQRKLRVALRAKARQLGDGSLARGLDLLAEEVAYEQWHRMLFARFLAENQLLMHPTGVPVTLEECADLATGQGKSDAWELAAAYAAAMLPGIFGTDAPESQVQLAREGREALEQVLDNLPTEVFTSEDGLGWVYQFWQSKKKREVGRSGQKIEGLDLAAYSQLFTEDYMVRFLLENSLGAWWADRHPGSSLVEEFTYLRRHEGGDPAAGTFASWPVAASDVKVMDPCCGSGHFLVAAFGMLLRMRMEEEGLDAREAGDAVLRDNLFGLELDPRCVQIATFALALASWKSGGYRQLPLPNLACSGIPLSGRLEEWTELARGDTNLGYSLAQLHHLFSDAPDLGSLINPADVLLQDGMFSPDFSQVAPALNEALAGEADQEDPVAAVFGDIARGVVRAAELLMGHYTLIATNVPYLTRNKQGETLKEFLSAQHELAKADLATAFVERCRAFAAAGGTYAIVTPQNWLFLVSYRKLRETLLDEQAWPLVARIGEHGFESPAAGGAFTALSILVNSPPTAGSRVHSIDASVPDAPQGKADVLVRGDVESIGQGEQRRSVDARVSFGRAADEFPLLATLASSYQGIKTGDDARFRRHFWEVALPSPRWRYFQTTVSATGAVGGLSAVLDWSAEGRALARKQGIRAWDRPGVAVSLMRELKCALYSGEAFDSNMAALIPHDPLLVGALWEFCSSAEFGQSVRRIDSKLNVTNGSVTKVPFDVERWQKAADKRGAVPEMQSDDPTQWLFKGDPSTSTEPLQVAVARLLGYRWPEQGDDMLSPLADENGLLPLVPVAGEEPAAERLRSVLAKAYGDKWTANVQSELLRQVGFGELETWLRDGFFEQHTTLFEQRPFIWHVWDGRRDGFGALANYHMLDTARLNRLIYTHLGGWIRAQRADREAGIPGADARLVAALALQEKLEAIRDGDPPHDIYARWKSPAEQPIGWDPDLNDGVRVNIRPFVEAGVLRRRVNVKWNRDRGLNPDGTERLNDSHYTLAEKRAAKEGANR